MQSYLIKALVFPFYRRHAVFFAVLFFCAFSFLNGRDHLELGKAILASSELLSILAILFVGWTGYQLLWLRKLLQRPDQQLTPLLLLAPKAQQMLYLLLLSLLLLLPLLFYACFLLFAGASAGLLIEALCLLVWSLFLLFGFAAFLFWLLRNPTEHQLSIRWQLSSWSLLFLRFYWRSNRWGLPVMIGFSTLFWVGCLALSIAQSYDSRFLYLISLLLAAVHYPLVTGLANFENQWRWLRQLPIARYKQLVEEILLFAALLLPEVLVALFFSPAEGREGLLLCLAVLFGLRGFYYYNRLITTTEIAGFFLLYFLLIMYQLPLFGLIIPFLVVGGWGYGKAWYSYEASLDKA